MGDLLVLYVVIWIDVMSIYFGIMLCVLLFGMSLCFMFLIGALCNDQQLMLFKVALDWII